jgi:beta-aspartyl-peptidase (threonine type)
MRLFTRVIVPAALALACALPTPVPAETPPAGAGHRAPQHHPWALVLHGGAGAISRASISPDEDAAYRAGLKASLDAAAAVLDRGGSALDAVEAAIELFEGNPLFNAAKGAVFAADGTNQLDAAIMDGATMKAGAVADVQRTRHPIALARAVMDQSPYVMLIGAGADAFAAHVHLEQAVPGYFFTERRWQALVRQLEKEGLPVPPRPPGAPAAPSTPVAAAHPAGTAHYGTVGVVALDRHGNIAAGTSTGGTLAKRWDRVGDSPIIGAGTYASNQSCAVSATGVGEFFIRYTVARTIGALVQYKGMRLQDAADLMVHKVLAATHGDGGVIAITPDGQMAWSFNTPGMFRARLREGGKPRISLYGDEP